jgi:uncharacterized protein (DUF2141 family)
MNIWIYPFIAFLIMSSGSAFGQVQKLTIFFNNLSTNDGKIMVLIQDENEKDASKLVLYISNNSAKADIYLPKGKYGLIAFHDINGNEKLDTNVLGVPTEPYGFSNDARGFLSKPDYEETLVELYASRQITFKLE